MHTYIYICFTALLARIIKPIVQPPTINSHLMPSKEKFIHEDDQRAKGADTC